MVGFCSICVKEQYSFVRKLKLVLQSFMIFLLAAICHWHPSNAMIAFPPYSPLHDEDTIEVDEPMEIRLVRESRQVRTMESRASYVISILYSLTDCKQILALTQNESSSPNHQQMATAFYTLSSGIGTFRLWLTFGHPLHHYPFQLKSCKTCHRLSPGKHEVCHWNCC